jgi:hypothetical protein
LPVIERRPPRLLCQFQAAVVVAVAFVRVMQMAVDQVVHMIAVRNRLMTAAGSVDVRGIMAATGMRGRACVGIGWAYLDDMLIEMVAVR